MKRNEIKILVIEDDSTQGKALQEALKRSGFEAKWAQNSEIASAQIEKNDFNAVIIDCLLPKMNGVDLAQKFKAKIGDDLVVILMSGIYKDKAFTRDALTKTNAAAFLTKPFELDKLITVVEDAFADQMEPDLPPLLETLTTKEVDAAQRQRALSEGLSLHGFDLPILYSLLFGSGLSGKLSIMASDGSASTLSFSEGKLTNVFLQDKTSYFGVLLVEMGFTSSAEVEEALSMESKKPIGERLVNAHSLSPHAIRIVRQEQMVIRLSRTIQDQFMDVTFQLSEVEPSDDTIQRDRFTQLAWDWICSKTHQAWLQEFYSRWMENSVYFAEPGVIKRRLSTIPGLENIPIILQLLGGQTVLSEAIESGKLSEAEILPALHLMLIEKLAWFGPRRNSTVDNDRSLKRLKKLVADASSKDYFQILGISANSGDREVNRAYMELAKIFHPDKLGPGTPSELRAATEQYFSIIVGAHDALKDGARRNAYTRELAEGSAEKVLQTESQFEQGQSYLRRGKFVGALEIFAQMAAQRQHRADLPIYFAWAKLKVGAPEEKLAEFLSTIGEMINRVPPEERHSANYFYVKGLYYYNVGDFEKAKTNFKHALMMDPKMVEARRDLSITRSRLNQSEQTRTNFSTVVTRLIGGPPKKKKTG